MQTTRKNSEVCGKCSICKKRKKKKRDREKVSILNGCEYLKNLETLRHWDAVFDCKVRTKKSMTLINLALCHCTYIYLREKKSMLLEKHRCLYICTFLAKQEGIFGCGRRERKMLLTRSFSVLKLNVDQASILLHCLQVIQHSKIRMFEYLCIYVWV